MDALNIRFSKPFTILMLVVGALLLGTTFLTEQWAVSLPGLLLLLFGLLAFVNPMARVAQGEAQRKNPFGMTVRRYPIRQHSDLRADEKALWHVPTGKKITTLGFGVDKGDAEKIRATFGRAPQTDAPNGQLPRALPPQGGVPYGQQPQGRPPQGTPQNPDGGPQHG